MTITLITGLLEQYNIVAQVVQWMDRGAHIFDQAGLWCPVVPLTN